MLNTEVKKLTHRKTVMNNTAFSKGRSIISISLKSKLIEEI